MTPKKGADDVSREEDFRDYDTQNIDEGWPYADQPGTGSDPAEIDTSADTGPNGGFIVDEADADGQEHRQKLSDKPGTVGLEDSDDLEERINDALEEMDTVEMELMDIHVDGGHVTIEGMVDEAATSRLITRTIQGMSGVRKVTNKLTLAGVDAGIPDED
jgi:hypothetical protein